MAGEPAAGPDGGDGGGAAPALPIVYSAYKGEEQLESIMELISHDLSEPYSIFTYRYFINNWRHLCFLAHSEGKLVGVIVCKEAPVTRRPGLMRGYIAMLAVDTSIRKRGIGTTLVVKAIEKMKEKCHEVMLETEVTNKGALRLYGNLGFTREKRLMRYYLNGGDAFRLKIWFKRPLAAEGTGGADGDGDGDGDAHGDADPAAGNDNGAAATAAATT